MTTFGIVAPRLRAHGFRPVPILNGTKRPPMKDWPGFVVDDAALTKYLDCGTGLLCGELVGVDIDVLDAQAAAELHQLTRSALGDGPSRIGQAPKLLVVLRAAVPFRKRQTRTFTIDGHASKVEVLADGQQFVAYAIHPDTKKPYTWPDGNPLDVPFAALPKVTEEQIVAFLEQAELILARFGVPEKPDRPNGGESPREHRHAGDDDPARRAYVEAAAMTASRAFATPYGLASKPACASRASGSGAATAPGRMMAKRHGTSRKRPALHRRPRTHSA